MMPDQDADLLVIGSGPAGQKAAIQGAKSGRSVILVESSRELGGSCVQRGTIPSKTLRENALRVKNMRLNAKLANYKLPEDLELNTLINRLSEVLAAHDVYMRNQVERNGVTCIHGKASFITPHRVNITQVRGTNLVINAKNIVIATGSIPRMPDNIEVDHEHIFDSDS
ncbi:MAG: FAD-dependent oxidoreductase, partial [Moraxellaceae bacterium]